jgi:hypothetical protein
VKRHDAISIHVRKVMMNRGTTERLHGERRLHARYSIQLPAVFKAAGASRPAHTLDLSARGLRLQADQMPPIGSAVEVAVEWPVLIGGQARLKLVYTGRVARTNGRTIALTTQKPEFRVAGRVHHANA